MSRLFSCDYDHYDMAKSCRNINFEEMDSESSIVKSDGFWLLWGMYIKQIIIMTVLCSA